jgi:mannosyl-3-phosphoglycerate phosphatase
MTNGTPRLVVFSELDDVILDRGSKSLEGARPALRLLRQLDAPLVLSSARTRPELELIREDLGNRHPFISENGSALFVPHGYFPDPLVGGRTRAGYRVLECALPYREVVSTVRRLAAGLGVDLVGFSDMSVAEVAAECGLSLLESRLAKLREYDEPFRLRQGAPKTRARLLHALQAAGQRCTTIGRFDHASSGSDLVRWIRLLRSLYGRANQVWTVGVAAQPHALPLLQAVDLPVILPDVNGRHDPDLVSAVQRATLARTAGPAGWSDAITLLVAGLAPFREASKPSRRTGRPVATGADGVNAPAA